MKSLFRNFLATVLLGALTAPVQAAQDLPSALRRAQYLLTGTMPTDQDFTSHAVSDAAYKTAVRTFLDGDGFYDSVLRYHERVLGVGLPDEYLQELLREDIDGKQEKFASITCGRLDGNNGRFRCLWTSNLDSRLGSGCPLSAEQPVSVFWYPGIVAWACPSIVKACGQDLSSCFVQSPNEEEARNAELGTTETFDSRYSVIKSLSRQAAGLATAVVVQNYPYTKVLEPGLTAVDGAVAHFYGQRHHFKVDELNLNEEVLQIIGSTAFTDTRFRLLKTSSYDYSSGGILSTFGWLRRYDKNRTRANELYKRLLCREFTSEPPLVFPQDPGNLREAPGCMGCHSTLDPLADFFRAWGEGGDLYSGGQAVVTTTFNNKTGTSLADLAEIVRGDKAFATCTVENVWKWLMGRKFYQDEEPLRSKLTDYFLTTNYSFRELVYAVSTHPAFTEGTRSDGIATDPLAAPPLGEFPTTTTTCEDRAYTFSADVQPYVQLCSRCHTSSGDLQPLVTESDWRPVRATAIKAMATGEMPLGGSSPDVFKLKDAVTCWLEKEP
jgi:hypothetical protein